MKRIIEDTGGSALELLLGEKVLLMCGNYFYHGTLIGVNDTSVILAEPSIVYETGKWDSSTYTDIQRLPAGEWNINISFIESFGRGK